ncbi:MAG: MaoC family dehydratase [Nitriliruptoraceae bacterium]
MSEAHPFGRYFDDFTVGDVYRHWPGKTITQAEDILFCGMTMNQHPLHSDDHFSALSQHGQPIVAGPLVYSLVVGQSVVDVSGKAIANLETTSLKHLYPTHHGDTIYSQSEVIDKRESRTKPDRGVVTVRTIGTNQDGEVVCEFVRKVLVPKRGHGFEEQGSRPEPRTVD